MRKHFKPTGKNSLYTPPPLRKFTSFKPPYPSKFLCVNMFWNHTLLMFFISLLLECRFSGKVLAALEINTTANQVYQLNFGDTKLLQKNIEVSLNITSTTM